MKVNQMRILSTLAALACLVSGCVLWLLGFQGIGVALAISSAVVFLALSVLKSPEAEEEPTALETGLDWGLVIAGLGAFAVTRDSFFLISAGLVAVTSPGIIRGAKRLVAGRES